MELVRSRLTARRTVAQNLALSKQRSAWVSFKPLVFVYSAPGHTRQIASRLLTVDLQEGGMHRRTKLRVLSQAEKAESCRRGPWSD